MKTNKLISLLFILSLFTSTVLAQQIESINVTGDTSAIKEESSVIIYTYVEQMPEFPGGVEEMYNFLAKEIKYPEVARKKGISGRVFVQFIVSNDSTIQNVQIGKGVDPYLDAEAARVVKAMPKWIPGKQNGERVKVQMSIPINFRLK